MKKSTRPSNLCLSLVGSVLLAALGGSLSLGCEAVLGGSLGQGGAAEGASGDGDAAGPGGGDGDAGNPLENDPVGGAVVGLEEGAPVTLLARLTNAEFVRSLEILLELPPGSPSLASAITALAPEASVHGLKNDASTQNLTQVAIAGYERLALAATGERLAGIDSNQSLAERLGCTFVDDAGLTECLTSYGSDLLQRASRSTENPAHPVTIDALLQKIIQLQTSEALDPTTFESRVLQLQSLVTYVALAPDSLLLIEGAAGPGGEPTEAIPLTAHEIATRLSYFLAGEPPDGPLLTAAAEDRLGGAGDRIAQVDRLLGSAEGRNTFVQALVGWLGINLQTVDSNDLEALSAYLNAWIETEQPFDQFYNGALEVDTTGGATATQQVGVLGTAAFLDAHTFPPTPAFITRGVFVVEQLLCQELPDDLPAEAFGSGEMTEREVLEVHSSQACATCHVYFDSYGAAFQNFEPEGNTFDAAFAPLGGDFVLNPTGDIEGAVSNLEELGAKMGASDRAPACMAQLFYRHAMRRSLRGGDGEVVTRLVGEWLESDMSLRSLLSSIVSAEEFALLYP